MSMHYLIETQVCFALLWAGYKYFMHGSGRLVQNRAYLLGMAFVSLLIPLLSIPVWDGGTVTIYPAAVHDGAAFYSADAATAAIAEVIVDKPFGWGNVLKLLYFAGVAVMTGLFVYQAVRMIVSARRARHARYGNVHIVHSGDGRAYSFFNYIFIGGDTEPGATRPIVAHEMCHVRCLHSIDAVVAQLFLIVFWWNPAVWLWKRSLKEIHEFQADKAVLDSGFDSEHYINLILGNQYGIYPEFASGFSYSLTKKRLAMISRKKEGVWTKLRILSALPVAAIPLALFSFTDREAEVIYAQANMPHTSVAATPDKSGENPENATVTFTPDKPAEKPQDVVKTYTPNEKKSPDAIASKFSFGIKSAKNPDEIIVSVEKKNLTNNGKLIGSVTMKRDNDSFYLIEERDTAVVVIRYGDVFVKDASVPAPNSTIRFESIEGGGDWVITRQNREKPKLRLQVSGKGDMSDWDSLTRAYNTEEKLIRSYLADTLRNRLSLEYGNTKTTADTIRISNDDEKQTQDYITSSGGYGASRVAFTPKDTEAPIFPEGDFVQWLIKNTEPPQKKRDRKNGKVAVTFTVESDGSLGNIRFVGAPEWEGNVLKALVRSPRWEPRMLSGRAIRHAMLFSVDFSE